VSDEFIVPLCRTHHREIHRSSDEVAWWKKAGIDAPAAADRLWRETHLARATAIETSQEITDSSGACAAKLDQ
jgi:hypothetical protein